jgi:uncharacterized protein YjbJ (UPF0337 family)
MNEDQVIGTAKNLGGKAQEAFGNVTGDTKSQVEGVINQAAGAAQDLYGQAKEMGSDAAQAIRSAPRLGLRFAVGNQDPTSIVSPALISRKFMLARAPEL